MTEHFHIETDGEAKPLYEGVNAPDFGPADDEHPGFDGDVYVGHVPEGLDLGESQRRALAMAAKAATAEADKPTLDQMHAEMWANEPASEDNRELFRIAPNLGRSATGRRLTIAQQNANEARHRAKAKEDRWGK